MLAVPRLPVTITTFHSIIQFILMSFNWWLFSHGPMRGSCQFSTRCDWWPQFYVSSFIDNNVNKYSASFGSPRMTLENLAKLCSVLARTTRPRSTRIVFDMLVCINYNTFICILKVKYSFRVSWQIWMTTFGLSCGNCIFIYIICDVNLCIRACLQKIFFMGWL